MASRSVTIAEAVKARLNAAPALTFNESFTAQRKYVPKEDLTELETAGLRVTVVALKHDQTLLSRAGNYHEIDVQVGLQRRIGQVQPDEESANTELDAYSLLTQQIADYLSIPGQLGSTGAYWLRTSNVLPYAVDELQTQRVFTSIVVVTYKI